MPLCSAIVLTLALLGSSSWAAAQGPRLVVQTGHSGGVSALQFSSDGTLLASASHDKWGNGEIKLWHVESGRELRTISMLGHRVTRLAFHPAGTTLAIAGTDNAIRLWDVTTGEEKGSLEGHSHEVLAVAFSPDGASLASVGADGTVNLWDVAARRVVRTLTDEAGWLPSLAFRPDGRSLAVATRDRRFLTWDLQTGARSTVGKAGAPEVSSAAFSHDGTLLATGGPLASVENPDEEIEGEEIEETIVTTVTLWAAATGRKLRTLQRTLQVSSFVASEPAFSRDGRFLATAHGDSTVTLWEVATGKALRRIKRPGGVTAAGFSPDSAVLATGGTDGTLDLWDVATAQQRQRLTRHAQAMGGLAFSRDGRRLANGHEYRTERPEDNILGKGAPEHSLRLWDLVLGRECRALRGHAGDVFVVQFTPDSALLASGSMDGAIKLWDTASGKLVRTLGEHSGTDLYSRTVSSLSFAPDGQTLASGGWDGTLRLWDVDTGALRRSFAGGARWVPSIVFSPDGALLASSAGSAIRVWDVKTAEERRRLVGHRGEVNAVPFSPDGALLASGSTDGTVRLWDVATGQLLRTMGQGSVPTTAVSFDPRGTILASGDDAGTVRLWEVGTGREMLVLAGHSGRVNSLVFHPEGRILASASIDNTIRLWEANSGKELARLVALDGEDWVVLTPEGLFDASPGGMDLLHWVVGNEPIALSQLKERYYEPGLLAKVLGFNKEPLRDVHAFREVGLYPRVEFEEPAGSERPVSLKLTNRGGGIGRVQVFVNDKELAADARSPQSDPSASQARITLDLAGAPWIPGHPNRVRVVAWNAEGYLSSRGVELVWTPPGGVDTPPELLAVVGGVSDYSSPSLDLRYAAKDADDMATALEIGARRLFGPGRVHLTLLSTSGRPGVLPPTKANFRRAFEEASRLAKPWDVLFVYLAGHGLALGGGHDTYCYLTSDARSPDLSDPEVRRQVAITSEELVDWVKQVPALKQVMVLDTCAAGLAALKLTERRDVGSSQIRAIERLKDRTGFHVLMGSSADAVSYEASQYAQGLLTYALLQGMRGAALRDEEYVDVSRLFQYAADKVPELARYVGGIQRPVVAAPRGTSFDVGRLTGEDKSRIPLAIVKPLVLRPVLLNRAEDIDDLELMPALRSALRDASHPAAAGRSPALVYVDQDELPGAIRPSGSYTVHGEEVRLRLALVRDRQKLKDLQASGPRADLSALVARILEAMLPALRDAMER